MSGDSCSVVVKWICELATALFMNNMRTLLADRWPRVKNRHVGRRQALVLSINHHYATFKLIHSYVPLPTLQWSEQYVFSFRYIYSTTGTLSIYMIICRDDDGPIVPKLFSNCWHVFIWLLMAWKVLTAI